MTEPTCGADVYDRESGEYATCGRPIRDQAWLCDRCSRTLERILAELPALADDLDLTITRQAKLGQGSLASNRSEERPVPFDEAAATALRDLRSTCVGSVKLVIEERGLTVWPLNTVPGMGRFLFAHHDWIRHHEAAVEILGEFVAITRTVRTVIDRHPTRTRFAVGPCPEKDEDGAPCPGEIRAHFPTDEADDPKMTCTVCAAFYPPTQWYRAGVRIRHMMVVTEADPLQAVDGQEWTGRSGVKLP